MRYNQPFGNTDTRRTSSGAELGNVVSRDLVGALSPLSTQVTESADIFLQTEKFLKRPRFRVLHDPTIEINLSNSKRTEEGTVLGGLTDKGVEAFIEALIECLKSPHGFQLLELNLAGNKLTV